MTKTAEKSTTVALASTTSTSLSTGDEFMTDPWWNDLEWHEIEQHIPFMKLCQKSSPQREENDPFYIKGLKPGDFFNTITREIYGPGPLSFTVLVKHPWRAVVYSPNQSEGILDYNVRPGDPRLKPQKKGEKPEATESITNTLYLHDSKSILYYRCSGRALRNMKLFLAEWTGKGGRRQAGYYMSHAVRSVFKTNDQKGQSWYEPVFEVQPGIKEEGVLLQAVKRYAEAYAGRTPTDLDPPSYQE